MRFLATVLFIEIAYLKFSEQCMATVPGGTDTTTTAAVTTTTTAATTTPSTTSSTTSTTTTTTTAKPACASCTPMMITFSPGDPAKPFTYMGNPDMFMADPATGCVQMNVVCAGPAETTTFMQFNINTGGPGNAQNFQETVTAPVKCVDGQWIYTDPDTMLTQVVTEVNCQAAPNN